MQLNEKQEAVLRDVFQTENAAGFTIVLLELFEGYLMSSNEDNGELMPADINNKFFVIKQLCHLLKAVEPEFPYNSNKAVVN